MLAGKIVSFTGSKNSAKYIISQAELKKQGMDVRKHLEKNSRPELNITYNCLTIAVTQSGIVLFILNKCTR